MFSCSPEDEIDGDSVAPPGQASDALAIAKAATTTSGLDEKYTKEQAPSSESHQLLQAGGSPVSAGGRATNKTRAELNV